MAGTQEYIDPVHGIYRVGDRVEFICDGYSYPEYGQRGTVDRITDSVRPIEVAFDGSSRTISCGPGDIAVIEPA